MDTEEKLAFPGRFDSLAAISEFVGQAARKACLDEQAVYQVQLAVDEACSNIIEHAYGGEGHGDIEIACRVNSVGLTVILRDSGRCFEPDSVPPPNLHASLENRDLGGLGLHLIYQVMDEVHFEFRPDSGNVLTMVKRK